MIKMASLSKTRAMVTVNSKQRGRQKDNYPNHGPCTLQDGSQKGAVLLSSVKNMSCFFVVVEINGKSKRGKDPCHCVNVM